MKIKYLAVLSFLLLSSNLLAFTLVDINTSLGKQQFNTAISYQHQWTAYKKIKIGLGPRITNVWANNALYITAGPAKYTRTFTTPFAIVFAGQKEENFDTLKVNNAQVNTANLAFHLGYQFNPKLYAGVNIDVIGFTLGGQKTSKFTGIDQANISGTFIETNTTPTVFNILPTGDHDRGTLNSEYLATYKLNKKIAIKALFQFLFIEYQTNTIQQRLSNGVLLNRFRNKANNVGIGVVYEL
jgi:hypothetical protein